MLTTPTVFFDDVAADVFVLVWMIIAATIVFLGLKSCWEARTRSNHNATSPRPPRDPARSGLDRHRVILSYPSLLLLLGALTLNSRPR